MNKTLFACLLGAVLLALGDSLTCNRCTLSIEEDCLGDSNTTVECAANQSCYIKTFTFPNFSLRTKGCISNARCNGSRTDNFVLSNNTISSIALSNTCCDTEDRCNHAPGLPAMLPVVVGAALVALGSRYTQ